MVRTIIILLALILVYHMVYHLRYINQWLSVVLFYYRIFIYEYLTRENYQHFFDRPFHDKKTPTVILRNLSISYWILLWRLLRKIDCVTMSSPFGTIWLMSCFDILKKRGCFIVQLIVNQFLIRYINNNFLLIWSNYIR